jgi:hypothetical protein
VGGDVVVSNYEDGITEVLCNSPSDRNCSYQGKPVKLVRIGLFLFCPHCWWQHGKVSRAVSVFNIGGLIRAFK